MTTKTVITSGALAVVASSVYLATRTGMTPPVAFESAPLPPDYVLLTIAPTNQNRVVVTWQNDAQSVDQLLSSVQVDADDGNWTSIQGATSSPVVLTMTKPIEFMRLARNPPPAPTNVLLSFNGAHPTVVKIEWQNTCSNCDSVNVFRSQNAQQWTQLAQLTATATNYVDSTAPNISTNTNFYQVRSRKGKVYSN